jgi:uroporphyrin-III C-methyltransferase
LATSQEFIERLMIRFARRGDVVARVKGGDPLIFGRGGEEAIALREAGIAFEIVPGISSGLAAPAAAGIPVTHRGLAGAVTFVSAHGAGGVAADWRALAKSRGTLVIFMGVQGLEQIADGLAAGGMARDMPVAAIERATWSDQRVLRADLSTIAGIARAQSLRSPAILVVGRTVALAEAIAGAARFELGAAA